MVEPEFIENLVGEDFVVTFMTQAGQKSVFRAVSESEDLVIKVVRVEEFDEDDDSEIMPLSAEEERLRREVRLMSSVQSPYLPEIGSVELGSIEIDGLKHLYFSEKYIGDNNVKDLIKNTTFTPAELIKFAMDTTRALIAYGEFEDGFVHRDLKPANIMKSDNNGNYILIDGGIHMLPSNPTITLSEAFIGTPRYASPEQILKGRRNTDPRSDIFSLGIIIYEIAQGEHPFYKRGMDPYICAQNQTLAKFDPITRTGYEEFNKLVDKMITQYQHARYASAQDLLKDLEEIE